MRRPCELPATHFLICEEALRMHEALTALGFILRQQAKLWQNNRVLHVRLIWRRERDRQCAVLSLNVQLPLR